MIQARWEAVVSRVDGEAIVETPKFPVLLDGKQVLGVSYKSGDDGAWEMSVPVPAEAVADGIRTIVILDGRDPRVSREHFSFVRRGIGRRFACRSGFAATGARYAEARFPPSLRGNKLSR